MCFANLQPSKNQGTFLSFSLYSIKTVIEGLRIEKLYPRRKQNYQGVILDTICARLEGINSVSFPAASATTFAARCKLTSLSMRLRYYGVSFEHKTM